MPTLLPVRPVNVAVPVNIPTVIASFLVVALLSTMTVLTPTKYPSMFGSTGAAAVHRY